jgi:hypothetical protein
MRWDVPSWDESCELRRGGDGDSRARFLERGAETIEKKDGEDRAVDEG